MVRCQVAPSCVAGSVLWAAHDGGLGEFKVSRCHCVCLGTASSRVGVPPYQPLRGSLSQQRLLWGLLLLTGPLPGKGPICVADEWPTPYALAHRVGGFLLGQHPRRQTPANAPSGKTQPCSPNSLSCGSAEASGDRSLALMFDIFYRKFTGPSALFLHFLERSTGSSLPVLCSICHALPQCGLVCPLRRLLPPRGLFGRVCPLCHTENRSLPLQVPWCTETVLSDVLLEMELDIFNMPVPKF